MLVNWFGLIALKVTRFPWEMTALKLSEKSKTTVSRKEQVANE